jgi:hypothetical protein
MTYPVYYRVVGTRADGESVVIIECAARATAEKLVGLMPAGLYFAQLTIEFKNDGNWEASPPPS